MDRICELAEVQNRVLSAWVQETARRTKPDRIVWLNGADAEHAELLAEAVRMGQLIPLHPERHPGSYLHRSHPKDVARAEACTYICTPTKEGAGPTNNWMSPEEADQRLNRLFDGAMRGRTMYVVPYLMGPKGSPFSRVGVELTDSIYVAVNMRIMTRVGRVALEHLGDSPHFVRGVHSLGTLDPAERYICHFPQDQRILSVNSGYGGNALLSKKCMALRISSWMGRQEGWLAEHMLLMGIEDPEGRTTYIVAALPSMCGKTNLAMLQPGGGRYAGYRVWCLGDDIAWLRPGGDGRLYAINPEAGFFGVAPGTNEKTNPSMMETISRNALFTNVALAPDRTVWWEGLPPPADATGFLDWQGQPWDPKSGQPAAHPNARFTVSTRQCPVLSPRWDDPDGVPISAILFGARRSALVPLVFEALSWQHGVYLGATLDSETTAAADGAVGKIRQDPMAMLPFCGYHMGDYFGHWLEVGRKLESPPRIFRVNWFRVDGNGRFLWPGFGENMRVLKWIIDRCQGKASAEKTPIGYLPVPKELDTEGLNLAPEALQALLSVEREGWLQAARDQGEFLAQFGEHLPQELKEEQQALLRRLAV